MWVEVTGQPRPRLQAARAAHGGHRRGHEPLLTRFAPGSAAPDARRRAHPAAPPPRRLHQGQDRAGLPADAVRGACDEAYDFFAKRGAIHSPVHRGTSPSASRPAGTVSRRSLR